MVAMYLGLLSLLFVPVPVTVTVPVPVSYNHISRKTCFIYYYWSQHKYKVDLN